MAADLKYKVGFRDNAPLVLKADKMSQLALWSRTTN